MKPGSRDRKLSLLITGDELTQLKRMTWMMAEAFGLDTRIEKYRGQRPIGLYQWDMDCLMAVVDNALKDPREYPDTSTAEYAALARLAARLRREYDTAFGR